MIKLSRYLAKYTAFLLAGIAFLVGDVMLNLNLPNMMSNIVNVGIQKSGIVEIAPRVMTPDTFSMLSLFMDDEDFTSLNSSYTLYSELDTSTKAEVNRTFPEAGQYNVLVYTGDAENRALADAAYGRASYAFTNTLQTIAAQSGATLATSSDTEAAFNFDLLSQITPMLIELPQEVFDDAIRVARETPESLTDGVAAVLNKAVYEYLGADTGWMQTSYILRTGLVMLLLSLANAACAIAASFCFARLGAGIARDLRRDIYGKVSGFTNAEMDRFSTSSLITRTTNDVTQVQMMYTMALRMLIYAPLMGAGGIVMAVRKSLSMSWTIGVGVVLIIAVIGTLFAIAMPRFKVMQKLVDRLNMVARENLTGLMVVRAFSNQKFQEDRFDKANQDLTKNSLFVTRAMATMMPVMMLVMNGISLLIMWVGADHVAASTLQVGDMIAYIQYAAEVMISFLFIAMIFVMVPRAAVSAERINEVLTSKSIIKDPKTPRTLGGRARGELAFNKVSFRYSGAEEDALHDISFTATPGQTTAFIGATGAGKTTLVNLIPRFYDVSEGSVTLDGVDIRELAQKELRDNIGYVPQKGLLFSGDIASNLRFGDEDASDKTLRTAAEIAQATEFIDTMDEGFQTEISQGGTNVSGGQRQRLAIARALVKKAPVYIFDDSFSALDFATDAKLRKALAPYTKKSTVLVVAQRVSSIMHAEQIVVLDDGGVAGIGTHEELLKNCSAYREIAESQMSKEELA